MELTRGVRCRDDLVRGVKHALISIVISTWIDSSGEDWRVRKTRKFLVLQVGITILEKDQNERKNVEGEIWVSEMVQLLEKDCRLFPKLVTLTLGMRSAFDDFLPILDDVVSTVVRCS